MTSWRRVAVLAVLGLTLAGCTSHGGSATGVVATYEPTGTGGFHAALQGVVTSVDGCLSIRAGGDGELVVPVFPTSLFHLDDTGPVWRGAPLDEGDEVSLTGGFVDAKYVEVESGAGCLLDEVFIVSQEQ